MMTIQFTLRADEYGGTGIFAAQDVAEGATVWQRSDVDKFYTMKEYEALEGAALEEVKRYAYFDYRNGERVVELNMDESRYFNHDVPPNVVAPDTHSDICIAARFIKNGEQLTYNYYDLDPEGLLCGSFLKDKKQPQ